MFERAPRIPGQAFRTCRTAWGSAEKEAPLRVAAARGRDGSYRRAWPSAPAGPWAACSGTGSPPRAGSPQGGSWVSVHGAPGIGPSGPPHGCSCPAHPPAHVPWPRCHHPLRLPPGEAGPLLGWPQAWRARSSDSHREALAPHISTFLAPFPGPDQIRWHLACENLDSGVLAVPQFPFGGTETAWVSSWGGLAR